MTWALTIRALRLRQGLKQAALADMLGLDQATVSRWERGVYAPTVAIQQQIREKIERFDNETDNLQALFDSVVRSPYRIILTAPGSFLMVASSESAREYFELSGDPFSEYNWAGRTCTPHQNFVYETVVSGKFSDKTITHIQSSIALVMPNGETVLNNSIYYPAWTGEAHPRFLVRIEGKSEWDGRRGTLVIHRATSAPETLHAPNE